MIQFGIPEVFERILVFSHSKEYKELLDEVFLEDSDEEEKNTKFGPSFKELFSQLLKMNLQHCIEMDSKHRGQIGIYHTP